MRRNSRWFEHVDRYTSFDALRFAYSLLTRSQSEFRTRT
jgi:anthraniloyl-CoA monooxygenase